MAVVRRIAISETVSDPFAKLPATLLIGAAPISPAVARLLRAQAGAVVAADGGARAALDLGLDPVRVIGDLDSLDAGTRTALGDAVVEHDTDQDTTDFEKCLARMEGPAILAAGFLGGRFDHSLAALSAVVSARDKDIVLLGEEDAICRVPGLIEVGLAPGTRVSLFPFGAVRGTSEGLEWPIDGLDLAPDGRVATSNRATGRVVIRAEGPLLLILPLDRHEAMLDALRRARSR